MTSLSEIGRSQEEFSETLTLVIKDEAVSKYYLNAVIAFARNFSDSVPRFHAHKTNEDCTDGLIIFFGRDVEEIKLGIKPDLICISVPSLGVPIIEIEGVLIRPDRPISPKNGKELVLATNNGAKVTLGLQDIAIIQGRLFSVRCPKISVEHLPASATTAEKF